jgi:ABC-2 type transport system permease protein
MVMVGWLFFIIYSFMVILLFLSRPAGGRDLTAYAAIAPVFIALWWLALFNAGWTITVERWNGTIEMLVASPSSFAAVILGRITAVTMLGIVSFGEAWLVARLIFGTTVHVDHAWPFVATVLLTLAAMAGTSVAMSSLFVLARNAVTFSNSASYPFYVLGGILAPVSVLPAWLRPLSAAVFLSWSADLLRAALRPGPMHDLAFRLGMVALLGACGFVVGTWAMRVILTRVRGNGELGTM